MKAQKSFRTSREMRREGWLRLMTSDMRRPYEIPMYLSREAKNSHLICHLMAPYLVHVKRYAA
jgi:hypothetical protein